MRNLAILILLLAAAKIGLQEWLYRTSTGNLIVETYQQRAMEVCRRQAPDELRASLGQPASVSLKVGRPTVNIWFWQVGDPLWNARFRNPYLLIVSGDRPGSLYCEYDIVHGAASVYRM
jgi:hypothetical protein